MLGLLMDADTAAFLEIIKNDKNTNKLVYVSIGSAANSIKWENGELVLDAKYNQQFPECLQELKKEYTDASLYILLFDPSIESPPYIVKDKKNITGLGVDKLWEKKGNMYFNKTDNISVYSCSKYVTCDGYNENKVGENITVLFNKLNYMAIVNDWFLLVHDFSGRNINDVAEYYDSVLEGHKDHIIYGIGYRHIGGCYMDLCNDTSKFVIESKKDEKIKIFNPYDHTFKQIKEIYNSTHNSKIKASIKICMDYNIKKFKSNILSVYRRLCVIKSYYNKENKIVIEDVEYAYIDKKYKLDFAIMYNKDYGKLIDIVQKIMISELYEISDVCGKNTLVTIVHDMIIKHTDPYKLSEYISNNLTFD